MIEGFSLPLKNRLNAAHLFLNLSCWVNVVEKIHPAKFILKSSRINALPVIEAIVSLSDNTGRTLSRHYLPSVSEFTTSQTVIIRWQIFCSDHRMVVVKGRLNPPGIGFMSWSPPQIITHKSPTTTCSYKVRVDKFSSFLEEVVPKVVEDTCLSWNIISHTHIAYIKHALFFDWSFQD